MAETKTFNEKFIELESSELLFVADSNYAITVNRFLTYIPNFDDGNTYPDTIAYAKVDDENPAEVLANKLSSTNSIDVELGIIKVTTPELLEADKESIKKSMKYYLRSDNALSGLVGLDATFLSRTNPIIKWYSNTIDTKLRILVTFNFKIKTLLT